MSKKRVFPGESSADNMEAEVVEIPPPPSLKSRGSKSKSREPKGVEFPTIIDVDFYGEIIDVMPIDEEEVVSGKGKGIEGNHPPNVPSSKNSSPGYDGVIYIDDLDSEVRVRKKKSVRGSTYTSGEKPPKSYPVQASVCSQRKHLSRGGPSSASSSSSTLVECSNHDDTMKRFLIFKKFDTVQDTSDHYYKKQGSSVKQPEKNWAKKIQEEWKILEKDLPDTIFVRVYESRMDLLRAVIVGAEGTPYNDGLYFFDVCFPSDYPKVPPQVHYHSGGLRINPNLYDSGKVCLSLLNTWHGARKEKWIPGKSTMLQVLVSIQGLILNAKPYFNEPSYAKMAGSVSGEKSSLQYNERTFILSLKTMVYSMKKPPKYFEDLVIGHFRSRAHDILGACQAYIEGAPVGSLVKGGVQDVDEGGKSCSQVFRNDVAKYVNTLIDALGKVGAKECEKYRPLAQKAAGVTPRFLQALFSTT